MQVGSRERVLDKGFLMFVDRMGDDLRVVDAARTSTDRVGIHGGVLGDNEVRLLNYLMEREHHTPFEKVVFEFQVKAPIFVFREWHRHRIASINEQSLRYTQIADIREFYIPAQWRVQDTKNKQGSVAAEASTFPSSCSASYLEACNKAFDVYKELLDAGVAREMARMCLPVSTYSVMFWTANLRSMLNFLSLRTHEGAQWEIRQYAKIAEQAVKESVPEIWKSWNRLRWFQVEGIALIKPLWVEGESYLETLARLVEFWKSNH